MHTVDRMLSLARAAGATPVPDLRLYAPESDRAAVAADPDLSSAPFAVLAPTSRWPGKRWPIDRFVRLAERMLRDPRLAGGAERLVIVGGPEERNQCGPLLDLAAREPRLVDRIGTTSVGGLLALVERSRLVVANDSAVLHIAVGFDRPMVALFGPTRVDRVGPYGRSADVVQHVTPADRLDHKNAESGRRLMERITVDDVLDRLHRLASSVNADTARRAAAG
jgi:heptosyltransferase-1/heptosyltransferase-2